MTHPEISVVMSVYNNESTLSEALDSILSQEGVDLELIVIDDGSTDGSGKILDEVAARDARLKVVHKNNEGLTKALVEGCAMASAPWIARQDADDLSLPGRLQAQWSRAQQPDAPVLITCGAMWKTPEGIDLFPSLAPDDPEQMKARLLDKGESICAHGTAFGAGGNCSHVSLRPACREKGQQQWRLQRYRSACADTPVRRRCGCRV